MNKKLIALAVAGACVAPAAMAQTANPVTLYGRIYATFETVQATGGTGADVPSRNRVSDQSSYLGVKGTEDLGGGLRAVFQLESSFHPDANDAAGAASTWANRNSGVGLAGAWGTVIMGRWDTPYKVTTIAVDPYGDLTIGDITNAMSGSGIRGVQGQFDRRDQNVVQYWSPRWAGVEFRASYSANEGRTATLNPRSNGASLTWTGGPIYVGYAYHELFDQTFGTPVLAKQQANAVFGYIDFGPLRFGADLNKNMRSGLTDQNAWLANVVWTIGNNQLSYQHSDMKNGEVNTIATEPHCKSDTLGWQYNFSKRTFFLAQYTTIDNNATSTCNLGSNGIALTSAGQDPKGVSLGLRHVF
jgi:predicted porin